MALARIYVDGEPWEIMGNVTDSFLPYTNSVESSRSGRIYATTESRVRTVSVDDVKLNIDEFDEIQNYFTTCGSKRFNVSVAINEDCPGGIDGSEGAIEYHYISCVLQGEPEFSLFERKIGNFEFAYEARYINRPN